MRRRAALSVAGAALTGLAGCASRQNDRDGSRSPTGTDPLAIEFDALQPAVFDLFVDAYELDRAGDSQYLFLTGADAVGPNRRFRFDGTEHDSGDAASNQLARAPSTFGPATEAGDCVVFELPETGDAGDTALVTSHGEWRPDGTLRERLAAPLPRLRVTFEGPQSVPAGRSPTFTVTVSNEGEYDGRFLGLLRRRYGPLMSGQLVSRPVAAGATVTLSATGDAAVKPSPDSGRGNTLTYELFRPDGSITTAVTVA